jgi:hypothetical protein
LRRLGAARDVEDDNINLQKHSKAERPRVIAPPYVHCDASKASAFCCSTAVAAAAAAEAAADDDDDDDDEEEEDPSPSAAKPLPR